jgi:hypothetical protein
MAAHLGTHVWDPSQRHGAYAWAIRPDIYLAIWILAWNHHALTTAPTSLFQANIFHPAPLALAYMDHMLGALPVYFPLACISGEPVWAHQATLVLTFAAAFLGALALVRDWTGSWPAAVLAGALFAFSPFRAVQLGAINLEGNYYLPLIVACARRTVTTPGKGWPFLLATILTLQALHSYQVGYAAFAGTAALCAVVVAFDREARKHVLRLVTPILLASAVVGISAIPYLFASRAGTLRPTSIQFLQMSSASLGDFGVTRLTLVLAILSIVFWRHGLRADIGRAWPAALVVVAVFAHVLALGPLITIAGHSFEGPWQVLSRWVPGFNVIRVPSRFVSVATMALAVLAGIGVAGAGRWLASLIPSRRAFIDLCAAVGAMGLAAWSVHRFMDGAPISLRAIETRETVPPVYRWLATAPPGAVLELPFRNWDVFGLDREREALLNYRSVYHWHPIVNGYSGHAPATYRLMAAIAARLPDPIALHDIAAFGGVRYIIIPTAAAPEWQDAKVEMRAFGAQTLVILPHPFEQGTPPIGRPLAAWRGRTPGGVPLAPLPRDAQRAALVGPTRALAVAGLPHQLFLTVENQSTTAWPGIALPGTGGVALTYQIWDSVGRPYAHEPVPTPLGIDLQPRERARVPFWFWAPPKPGNYEIEVRLIQEGVGPFDPALGGVLRIPLSVVKPG